MARLGVTQLQRLTICYDPKAGASKGVVNFVEKRLPTLKSQHPNVTFDVKLLKGYKDPHIDGYYASGKVDPVGKIMPRVLPVENFDEKQVKDAIQSLLDRTGTGKHSLARNQSSIRPSIQGFWHPHLMLWKVPLKTPEGETLPQVSARIVEHQQRKELGDLIKSLDTQTRAEFEKAKAQREQTRMAEARKSNSYNAKASTVPSGKK